MEHHVEPNAAKTIRSVLEYAGPGDVIWLHAGVYSERISTYDGPIFGGTGEGSRLEIKAWPGEPVIIAPGATGERCVNLATAESSWLSFHGITFDGSGCVDAVKLTFTSDTMNACRSVLFSECDIAHAEHQGVLTSGIGGGDHRFERCLVHQNGTPGTNKDHGLYLSNSGNTVDDCDIYENAAYGVHVYDGSTVPEAHQNVVTGCRVYGHTTRSGILLGSGWGNVARRNVCWGNTYGVLVDGNSRDAVVVGNVLAGNRDGAYFIRDGAEGTIVADNDS